MFPGKIIYKIGSIQGPEFRDLMSGTKKLIWELAIDYDGPKGHYKECEREEFLPSFRVFSDSGQCIGKPE